MLTEVVLALLLKIKDSMVVDTGGEIKSVATITLTEDGKGFLVELEDDQGAEQLAPTEQPDEQPAEQPASETFPEQKQREAKEAVEAHKPVRRFIDSVEQVPNEIINAAISQMSDSISSREQAITSAGYFSPTTKISLARALDCEVEDVSGKLADYLGFYVQISETKPDAGVVKNKCPHCGKKIENPMKLAVHIKKRHPN